jgi:hypothetical protein
MAQKALVHDVQKIRIYTCIWHFFAISPKVDC